MKSTSQAALAAKAHEIARADLFALQKGFPFRAFAIVCCLFALSCLLAASAYAQDDARDYFISTPLVSYSADGASAIVTLDVTNQGGDALEVSTITIAENESGRIETSVEMPALAAGEVFPFVAELPLDQFPEGDVFLKIEVGIDLYELAGSPIARDNSQLFRINVAEARPASSDELSDFTFVVPLLNFGVKVLDEGLQINDSVFSWTQVLIGMLAMALGLVILWLCLLVLRKILRLIFRTAPRFDVWQPPYATGGYVDPDSAAGRRQGWQFHARNSAINAPCAPNHLTAVKRLVNADGQRLGAWQITAIRSEQYDIYGRVSQTSVIMPRKIVKQLNKLAGTSVEMDNQQLNKALQPIAKGMSKAALRRIEKQNRSLPIALDLRLEGSPPEAKIIFELYQCRNAAWHLLDQWEPELASAGKRIPEQFTYTLNGILPDENYRKFKARLPQDLTQLLGGLLYHHQSASEAQPAPAASEQIAGATSAMRLDEPADESAVGETTATKVV